MKIVEESATDMKSSLKKTRWLVLNNNEEIMKRYFSRYDLLFSSEPMKKFPVITGEYSKLKSEIFQLIQNVETSNFFSKVKELLLLDAYLQEICCFLSVFEDFENELEVLEICRKDKKSYYKESFGCRLNDLSPNTFLFELLDNPHL